MRRLYLCIPVQLTFLKKLKTKILDKERKTVCNTAHELPLWTNQIKHYIPRFQIELKAISGVFSKYSRKKTLSFLFNLLCLRADYSNGLVNPSRMDPPQYLLSSSLCLNLYFCENVKT